MKGISKKQIETMQNYMLSSVSLFYNDGEALSRNIKKVDNFLNAAAELYIIDWKDRQAIKQEVFGPAMDEITRRSKEGANR